MCLPPELWVRIVQIAVEAVADIKLPHRLDNARPLAAVVQQPAVTRVSRAVRRETLAHFYRRNTFVYRDHGTTGEPLLRWLGQVQSCDWAPLCKVVLETRFPNAHAFFDERLSRVRLPFQCKYQGSVDEPEDDGAVVQLDRYRLALTAA